MSIKKRNINIIANLKITAKTQNINTRYFNFSSSRQEMSHFHQRSTNTDQTTGESRNGDK